MQSKKEKNKRVVSILPSEKAIDFTHEFEQLMRTDLARHNLNKPASTAYDRVKH